MTDLERVREALDERHHCHPDFECRCEVDGYAAIDAHLKEDAEREQNHTADIDRLQALAAEKALELATVHANWDDEVEEHNAELARLREELKDHYEGMCNIEAVKKLREENETQARLIREYEQRLYVEQGPAALEEKYKAQRDDLLAALKEIATETYNPAIGLPSKPLNELHNIARTAIAKVEGES